MKNYNISEQNDIKLNFTLIDGLTLDIIKRKYIWLLNAVVEDAIIGQDDYGLVWYSGNWHSGEWKDGTWYSGIWYDGDWKNGKFYSYRFDEKQLVLRRKRILEKNNNKYSHFRKGIWRNGHFYGGFFGPEEYSNYDDVQWDDYSKSEILYWHTRWEKGIFHNGVFRNAVWLEVSDGYSTFEKGNLYNSQWLGGTFLNGVFEGHTWWDGYFNGGDFIKGLWKNGNFNQSDINIKARFGSSVDDTIITWEDGTFINGEFHSGLNINVSGITEISETHDKTIWMNGTLENGIWYGGTFSGGTFNNGYWLTGYWVSGIFNGGYWYNGYWTSGIINGGYFITGLFNNVKFNNGVLGYQSQENLIPTTMSIEPIKYKDLL